MSDRRILERIARAFEEMDPIEALERALTPTDLQSLLLHVARERSRARSPREILAQYERSPAVRPSAADARHLLFLERVALESASRFEPLELPPVAPLGVNFVLGGVSQDLCLATVRGSEVLADPTTLLALECARRRRSSPREEVRLCARSRQLRLQPFDNPDFSPHFALFSMVTAGRDRGSLAFETESLREQAAAHLELLRRLSKAGYAFENVVLSASDTAGDERRLQRVEQEVLDPLSERFPEFSFRVDRERQRGLDYYRGLCFSLDAEPRGREPVNLGDGGFTDWTARLLSNAKERLLTSAIGTELIAKVFRA